MSLFFLFAGLGMLQVRGPIVVDVPGVGLSHLSRAPLRAPEQPALLADFLPRLPELPPVPQQKYRLFAPKDRQLELPQQVPQPAGGQAQALAEAGRGQRRRPAQPVVKQSRGFGPAAAVRLETDRHSAHLGAPPGLAQRLVLR